MPKPSPSICVFRLLKSWSLCSLNKKRFGDALASAERGRARAFLDLLEGRKRNLFGDNKLAVLTGGESPAAISKPKAEALVASADLPAVGPRDNGDPYATVSRGVSVVPRNPNQADLETALSPINADAPQPGANQVTGGQS